MLDINNLFMYEELIKKQEKIPILGFNPQVASRLNKFTIKNGTLDSKVLGGKAGKNRILVI